MRVITSEDLVRSASICVDSMVTMMAAVVFSEEHFLNRVHTLEVPGCLP